MKVYLLAAVLFAAPIIGVFAMHPEATKQSVIKAQKWAKKTFPTPKRKPRPMRQG
jgi:hypothetical protein